MVFFNFYCHLLITFAKRWDPDQGGQNIGGNLDPNCLTLIVFLKVFFEKAEFEKRRKIVNKGFNTISEILADIVGTKLGMCLSPGPQIS